MNINLLSQNLLILFVFLTTALLVFLTLRLIEKKRYKALYIVPAIGVVVAVALQLWLRHQFPEDQLPLIGLMALPLLVSIPLVFFVWKKNNWWIRATSIIAIPISLLLAVLLVNNYYQYYPKLHDVFSSDTHHAAEFVTPLPKHTNQKQTIEDVATQLANAPKEGHVYPLAIPGTKSHFNAREGWIYIPPAAYTAQRLSLPVVVLLGGIPGGPKDWIAAGGADTILDAFASKHHGVTPIVVGADSLGTPFNDTECVDSPRGNAETYLTQDLPAYIRAQFDVSSNPAKWAIGGLSDGGMCGAMLALRHPDTYRYFLDFGGSLGPSINNSKVKTISTLFAGSETAWQDHQIDYILAHLNPQTSQVGGYFTVGDSDSRQSIAEANGLYQSAIKGRLNTVFRSLPGHHTFDVWKLSLTLALPWLSNQLGATNCEQGC